MVTFGDLSHLPQNKIIKTSQILKEFWSLLIETRLIYHNQTALQINWLYTSKNGCKSKHLHKNGRTMDLLQEI